MPILAVISLELVGVVGGALCCSVACLAVLSTLGVIIYRAQQKPRRPTASNARPALPEESPTTAQMLSTVVGYRPAGDHHRVRERWGRPVTYTRTTTEGAHWFTPSSGITLKLTERNGRPGGTLTGDTKLDERFFLETSHPTVARQLVDSDLRERLLALPQVHIESDGRAVTFVDDLLQTHQKVCAPYDPASAEGCSRQVRMHDAVADVLVMIADRIG